MEYLRCSQEIVEGRESDISCCIVAYNLAMSAELGVGHVDLSRDAWDLAVSSVLWQEFLVAKVDGKIAGFVLTCAYQEGPPIIQMLAVLPNQQRLGAGAHLLRAALAVCRRRGSPMALAFVRSESARSQRFYASHSGVILLKSPTVDFYGSPVFPVVFGGAPI